MAAMSEIAVWRRNSKEWIPPELSDLKIALLGNSVSETSRVGNFILGREAFDTEAPSSDLEQYCERVRGKQMTVINTPLLLNPDLSLRHITQGVRECVSLSAPGPHVIVLVLNHECSKEEAACVEMVLNFFSDRVFEQTMVLTTQEPERVELDELNDVIKEIIEKCFNRHYRWEKNSTSADLISTIKEVVQRNDGRPLICDKYSHFTAEGTQASKLGGGWNKPTESIDCNYLTMSSETSKQPTRKGFSSGITLSVALEIRNKWSSKTADGSNESLPIFKLHLHKTWQNSDGFCRRSAFENKTIMMIGATGSGKTTLINSMINYILGVKWEDDFRFVLIDEGQQKSQAESQTSEVTAYQINHMDGFRVPYSLTIVDTPGFGDTRGIKQDQKITAQIQELFSAPGGIDCIDAVCFVVQASLARLTHTQKYVFDSILSIFGKDIAENILMMVTFADGKKPPVIKIIKESEVPCSSDESGRPLHFKFNNSAVFANVNKSAEDEDSDCENFDQMFWKMGFSSMKRFFTFLNKMETKSLTLTRQVLEEQKQLQVHLQDLQPQINAGLTKLDEIKKTRAALEQNKAEMGENEVIVQLEHELKVVQEIVTGLIAKSQKSLEHLQEIALKPNPLSPPDYINLMIESEEQEAKSGFTDHIESLMEAKRNAELISKISTGGAVPEDLKTYKPETRNPIVL